MIGSAVLVILSKVVYVVNEIVALIDGVSDHFLNAESLQPWLTIREINVRVSTEERIPSTHLVELYK